MSKVLLALDTDHIKRYVFATGKLREIRGASKLLDELNRKGMAREIGAKPIYANGGSGLFLLDSDAVSGVITKVKRAFSESTAGAATVTAACVELQQDFNADTTPIQPHWKQLSRKLELAKMQSTAPQAMTTFPLLRHCDSCGEHAAIKEKDGDLICSVCLTKRIRNDKIRDEEDLPDEFEDISELSEPKGYFALLYADGDGLGAEIEKNCPTLSAIGKFATAVDAALCESKNAATGQLQLSSEMFDTLLLGGDDLVMALPAQYALEAAYAIVVGFRERIRKALARDLRVSAAVVWAHDKFPFASFLRLTESALKFAKTEGARRRERGLINFLVVSNANHLDFGTFYKHDLTLEKNGVKIVRTLRPYTPELLRQLLDARASAEVAEAPRSKIQQLRQAVFQSNRQQASLDAIIALAHWRNQDQRKYFMELPKQLFPSGSNRIFPWVEYNGELRTPFVDLAEIYDFTEGGHHAD